MTFDEALSIPKDLRFQKNGSEKYYRLIIESLGYEEVKRCIPFTLGELKKAYKKDQSFNTLSIMNWDYAAGYITRGSDVYYIGSSLTRLYNVKCGVTEFSCALGVCILKECAKMWIEESASHISKMSTFA